MEKTSERISENKIVEKKKSSSKRFYYAIKRLFDILGSFLGLIILSPLLFIISATIKIEDGGSVYYEQERLGKDGKTFKLYKFRSMKENADDLESMLTPEQLELYKKEFKLVDDPRITKVGKFLRKTSLDELPQMVNIFLGELSVIGPRPIVQEELVWYGEDAKKFLSVKPGLTGYWQAYARNDANYVSCKRQKMELYYIDNQSVWLDIKIFFKTFTSILRKTGQ